MYGDEDPMMAGGGAQFVVRDSQDVTPVAVSHYAHGGQPPQHAGPYAQQHAPGYSATPQPVSYIPHVAVPPQAPARSATTSPKSKVRCCAWRVAPAHDLTTVRFSCAQFRRQPRPQHHVGDENGSPISGAGGTGSPTHAVAAAARGGGKQRRPGVRDLASFMSNPSPSDASGSGGSAARGGAGSGSGAAPRVPPVPLQGGYGQAHAQASVQSGYSHLHGQQSFGSAHHASPGYSDGSGTFGYGSPGGGQYSGYSGGGGGYDCARARSEGHVLGPAEPPCLLMDVVFVHRYGAGGVPSSDGSIQPHRPQRKGSGGKRRPGRGRDGDGGAGSQRSPRAGNVAKFRDMKYLAQPSYQYQDGEVNPREANEERAKNAESQLYYSRKARPVDYKCVPVQCGVRDVASLTLTRWRMVYTRWPDPARSLSTSNSNRRSTCNLALSAPT